MCIQNLILCEFVEHKGKIEQQKWKVRVTTIKALSGMLSGCVTEL